MKIYFLTERDSWINEYLRHALNRLSGEPHDTLWVHHAEHVNECDLLFVLGYCRKLPQNVLFRASHPLVVHESALPLGRGWSPMTWQVIDGADSICVTMFRAETEVDTGDILHQVQIALDGTELVGELRRKQWGATWDLVKYAIDTFPDFKYRPQIGEPTYYARRGPDDSQLDVEKTIREQFNLLRTVDNEKYPAYFIYKGICYRIKIDKVVAPCD